MRAFMSTGSAGNSSQAPWIGEVALAEAQRILGEIEPQAQSKPNCDHGPRRLPAGIARAKGRPLKAGKIRHWTVRQDVEWEARRALASDLESFLSLAID